MFSLVLVSVLVGPHGRCTLCFHDHFSFLNRKTDITQLQYTGKFFYAAVTWNFAGELFRGDVSLIYYFQVIPAAYLSEYRLNIGFLEPELAVFPGDDIVDAHIAF